MVDEVGQESWKLGFGVFLDSPAQQIPWIDMR